MAESNIRIIDNEGNPSFRGRVEFRNQGIWGTCCSKNTVNSAARVICK